ncbi:hypothetical protein [Georgenia sp. H159]|uniref:hypothetical protein n=1 Tax=Georgenia sp. H159 TaxID=3076115 RepID=UPI002D770AAB|nr:hypothetical protein [Georgenia sp. H159]
MTIDLAAEAALDASRGWRTNRHSWRATLAADYEISQARLRAVIESSEDPEECL